MSSRGFGSGLGLPLSLANGGTGQASGAWTSSAVAVTAVSGTGFVSAGGAGGGGRNSTTGLQFVWDLASGGSTITLVRYDNAFPAADGSVFNFSGVFEATT